MSVTSPPTPYNTAGARNQARRKPKEMTDLSKRSQPVQLSIFDYAASIGVALLPEAS